MYLSIENTNRRIIFCNSTLMFAISGSDMRTLLLGLLIFASFVISRKQILAKHDFLYSKILQCKTYYLGQYLVNFPRLRFFTSGRMVKQQLSVFIMFSFFSPQLMQIAYIYILIAATTRNSILYKHRREEGALNRVA